MTDEPKPLPITDEELGELLFAQRADGPPECDGTATVWALAWFPKDEWARAIEMVAGIRTYPEFPGNGPRRLGQSRRGTAIAGEVSSGLR